MSWWISLLIRLALIASACYFTDDHPVLASWCLFASIIGNINLNINIGKRNERVD